MNKLHNGSIYRYGHKTVRLNQKVGAVASLRAKDGHIFMGRSDLLRPACESDVDDFIESARAVAAKRRRK